MGTGWESGKIAPVKKKKQSEWIGRHNRKDLSELAGKESSEKENVSKQNRRFGGMIGNHQRRNLMENIAEKNGLKAAQANAEKMGAMQEVSVMRRASLAQLHNALKKSKRGDVHISKESVYYREVNTALESINSAMGENFSIDMKGNLEKLVNMESLYQQLISACGIYVAKDKDVQARKEIVLEIEKQASKDILGLAAARSEFCSLSVEEQAQKNWNEIIDKVRTVKMSVKDFSKLEKASGGQASEVLKMKGENVQIEGADGTKQAISDLHFFKPEDEIDLNQKTIGMMIINNVLERFPKLSKSDRKKITDFAGKLEEPDSNYKKPKGLSEMGEMALTLLLNNAKGALVTKDNLLEPSGILEEGGKVNMTKRNVATSRFAALLGLDYLVAKSESVEVYDEATNQIIRGNLMEKADGIEAKKFLPEFKKNHSVGTSMFATAKAQKDLVNLQVLDVLCGQMDRHDGNFMIQVEGGDTITGIKGIDNDASFGNNVDVVLMDRNGKERHDRRVYDIENGKMALPYMDKNLAERILVLEPDVIRFALKGLISDREIESAIIRLNMMKKAIATTKNKQPERFLEEDQWNEETAQTMIKQEWKARSLMRGYQDTIFAMQKKIHPEISKIKPENRTEEQREIWNNTALKIQRELKHNMYSEYASNSNYFGRFMVSSMGYQFLPDSMPELKTMKK